VWGSWQVQIKQVYGRVWPLGPWGRRVTSCGDPSGHSVFPDRNVEVTRDGCQSGNITEGVGKCLSGEN
jgi:hypothetical protein